MRVYVENGMMRPFSCVVETPRGPNTIALRNIGQLEFPFAANVFHERIDQPSNECLSSATTIQGGALRTYPFDPSVDSVQVRRSPHIDFNHARRPGSALRRCPCNALPCARPSRIPERCPCVGHTCAIPSVQPSRGLPFLILLPSSPQHHPDGRPLNARTHFHHHAAPAPPIQPRPLPDPF
jgi:hypothetical protein